MILKLEEIVIANSTTEAVEASPYAIGQRWYVKEINARLSPDSPVMGSAKWIIEALFTDATPGDE